MASIDLKTETPPSTEEPEEMPLPSDPKTIFLGCLLVLALLAAAYVASEIVLPLAFAMMLSLLLQPALRVLERWYLPRILAALLLIVALFGTIVGLGTAISGPAATWAAKLPEGIPRLSGAHKFLTRTHQCCATICRAGSGFWRDAVVAKRDRVTARPRAL
jgi:predicted PurR-regulated permease PerM